MRIFTGIMMTMRHIEDGFDAVVGRGTLTLFGNDYHYHQETFSTDVAQICAEASTVLGKDSMRYIHGGTRAFRIEDGGKHRDLVVWLKHNASESVEDVRRAQLAIEAVTIKLRMLGARDRQVVAPDLMHYKDTDDVSHYVRISQVDMGSLWQCSSLSQVSSGAWATLGKDFMRCVDFDDLLPDGRVFVRSVGSDGVDRYWLDYPAVVAAWVHWNGLG